MTKRNIALSIVGLIVFAILLYQIPAINSRLSWRFEVARTYVRNVLHPVGNVPTAIPQPANTVAPTIAIQPTQTNDPQGASGVVTTIIPPTPTLAPPPAQAFLNSPPYEKQTANNCGPAALSMMLHMFGWNGSQKDISDVIKPVNGDRNVNPEEMAFWVRNYAGWLRIEYRVGGDLETLKRLLAAAYPVIVESTTALNREDSGWADDDLWAAHYLLLTGYDDAAQTFTAQDTYRGPDKTIPYAQLESEWKPFNYVYLIVYLPEQEEAIKTILGSNWDADLNRQRALELAQAATAADASDSFAWFNVGSNLVYFERYDEANAAYDTSRELGLPQRMFRYQFGPFLANFHANRNNDLLALTEYALQRTEMSEETWLWRGWALYRDGDLNGAIKAWRKALSVRPGYEDALYALNFVGSTP
ncbi:MAG: C39 family peptidase [Anaerolineae bacterium]|nr:C39 family peptidase [Anaerolineae bacterium]MBL8104338.1 C39 family peptidase [Anaerolineales bacterium]MCC7190398.1 C39 family peptidase [Anaerolineales bacterium]HQU35931.1 C39 family peptidase [Anaerolineales bacterium]